MHIEFLLFLQNIFREILLQEAMPEGIERRGEIDTQTLKVLRQEMGQT